MVEQPVRWSHVDLLTISITFLHSACEYVLVCQTGQYVYPVVVEITQVEFEADGTVRSHDALA